MQCVCDNGVMLDESQGVFTTKDGRDIEYHNGRFMLISEDSAIIKATIPDDVKLPNPLENCTLFFDVDAGERYCRLRYAGFSKK